MTPSDMVERADKQGAIPPERLADEFELVQQAFFTDPEDQSAYIYHRWLLNESMAYCIAQNGTDSHAAAKQASPFESHTWAGEWMQHCET